MAATDYYIIDSPLPEALDAEALKLKGIAMLQCVAGNVWTNFNDSDPGVTILDQLCYALTELGYCGQFPIEDILTQANGEIRYRDQFFEPQAILTCSPVTIDDYRKLVLDAIPEIRAIYITAETNPATDPNANLTTGRYLSYLCLHEQQDGHATQSGADGDDPFLVRVQVFLNQQRNLGEYFLLPQYLSSVAVSLGGNVSLTATADPERVRAKILAALRDYAVPMAVQSGYSELIENGIESDQIFNGPKLSRGWMAGPQALRGKCNNVRASDLATLIAKVPGVLAVDALTLTSGEGATPQSEIAIDPETVPDIALAASFVFLRNGIAVTGAQESSKQNYLQALTSMLQAASLPASVDLCPPLPSGKFRDIEDYYSVQNTFPDIYGIGFHSRQSGGTPYQSARSRQLKGYLMAFDQLLANQFAQLAHVDELFSFASPAAPQGHQGQRDTDPTASIPNAKFATTRYCQPLYGIPDVKPLLLGNNAFRFQYDSSCSEKELEAVAWAKFCDFEFNEYIHGLRQCVESGTEALTRRDAMLSHLMARHGDDSSLYNEMIASCQWFGGVLKTRIIVKTIWLQNFEQLSYYRTRACDYQAPLVLPQQAGISQVEDPFHLVDITSQRRKHELQRQAWWQRPAYPEIDGEVDQRRIYSEARLTPIDLRRYSAFELKAGILLGLPIHWRILASRLMALLDSPAFQAWLEQPTAKFCLAGSDISVQRKPGEPDQVLEGTQCVMQIALQDSGPPSAGTYQDYADQLVWLARETKGFLLVEAILDAMENGQTPPASIPTQILNAELLYPNYTTVTQQPEFSTFLTTLIGHHWPAHVALMSSALSYKDLAERIDSYVQRRNAWAAASRKAPTAKADKAASQRPPATGLPFQDGAAKT